MDKLISIQRGRNRQIEWLELSQDINAIAELGLFEFINIYFDFAGDTVPADWENEVYSSEESHVGFEVTKAMEKLVKAVNRDTWNKTQIEAMPEFKELRKTSKLALDVFNKRGKFCEDFNQFLKPQ